MGEMASSGGAPAVAAAVRWESFLLNMVMNVLLVEADDSTRHIITLLLKKCSYKVNAVPDGFKAWEMLNGILHSYDLILTEVDLPSIPGFALLTLIMEHEICKNIPVIMMSSQDSVSTVYKCMLRGAADFLVKPVRKNELRNLWQHVWRRQTQSSSGGPGAQEESTAQQKIEATAENNANNSCDMVCIQKNRDFIEKGTDAQSSCAKLDLDVEGAEAECAMGLLSDVDINNHESYLIIEKKVQPLDCFMEESREATGSDAQRTTVGDNCPKNDNYVDNESIREVIDLIGAFDNYHKRAPRVNGANVAVANKVDPLPDLELSLQRYPSDSVNQVTEERDPLNHSDTSAFSRYVDRTVKPQNPSSSASSGQQKDQKSNSNQQLSSPDLAITLPEETETKVPFSQHRLLSAPIAVRGGVSLDYKSDGYNALIPKLFRTQSGLSAMQSSGSANAFYQLHHPHAMFVQNSSDMAVDQNEDMEKHKLENVSSATDHSANSSFCTGTVNQYQNLLNAGHEKANAAPFLSTSEYGSGGTYQVPEGSSLKSMQRAAALQKFRMKRKDRCFEKKVRYASRQKLAEKRPRVKGQFVRQAPDESASGDKPAG